MFSILLFVAAWATCLAKYNVQYSYSSAVGGGSGASFSSSGGRGSITAIRVWEIHNLISGIQLRYGDKWDHILGRSTSMEQRMYLFEGETIIQVSGKYSLYNYIYQLIFVTSKGRSLIAGEPTQNSFNFYAKHPEAELRLLSGRFNGHGITSLGAHWGFADLYKEHPFKVETTAQPLYLG